MPDPGTLKELATLIKAGKPAVEVACRAFEALLGKPMEVAGGLMSDALYRRRVRNQLEFLSEALPRLNAIGIDPRQLAAEFGLPLLDAVGSVEDPDLRQMWVSLLATSLTDPGYQHPLFVDILRNLSVRDARAFRDLAEGRVKDATEGISVRSDPIWSVMVRLHALGLVETFNVPGDLYHRAAWYVTSGVDGPRVPVMLSHLGSQFYAAVGGPRELGEEE
jgi:hypothetical protein